jgi:anti-sigma B factor antagonist
MRPVSVRPEADAIVRVALRGEIDAPRTDEILREIRWAIEKHRPRVVSVDLSDVTFIDTSGLGALVNAMQASRDAGADYRVVQVPDPVRAKMRMTGLLDVLDLTDEAPLP